MQKKIVLLMLFIVALSSCASLKQSKKEKPEQKTTISESSQQQLFSYYYYQALAFQNNKEYDSALETFLLCYQIDSLHAGLNYDIAIQYQVLGFVEPTTRYLKKAVSLSPDNWWYSSHLVRIFSELKRWDEAIEVSLSLKEHYPEKPELYSMLGGLYTQKKEFEKAIAVYDKLEAITGVNEQLSITKCQLLLEMGKPDAAFEQINVLIAKYPAETRYKLLLGDVYLDQKQGDKALAIYEKVLAEEPENSWVYISLLRYYDSIGSYDKLTALIISALKEDLLAVDAKIGILGQYVEILSGKGKKLDEIESLIKILLDKYPYEEDLHVYYALFLKFQKRDADLLKQLEMILSLNAKNDFAWTELIQESLASKNYANSLKLIDRALPNFPKEQKFYFYKAMAQGLLEEYRAALATCETLLELLKDSNNRELKATVYSQMGDFHYKLNEREKSFENYKEALLLNPDDLYLMNNYAYYLSEAKKDLKYAENLSMKTIEKEPDNSTFLDTYAWILYQQGSYSLAKFYIERAIENFKDKEESAVIFDHYADILWMCGEKEKAFENWNKALSLELESEELKTEIENKIRTKSKIKE